MGRKNWLFFGSDGGGETAAVPQSLTVPYQQAGVEPYAYLSDVRAGSPTSPCSASQNSCPQTGNRSPPEASRLYFKTQASFKMVSQDGYPKSRLPGKLRHPCDSRFLTARRGRY